MQIWNGYASTGDNVQPGGNEHRLLAGRVNLLRFIYPMLYRHGHNVPYCVPPITNDDIAARQGKWAIRLNIKWFSTRITKEMWS